MGLVHQFAIIPKDSNESIISSDMDFVSVSDMLIQYIGDSLKWVHTTWNGKRVQKGISYYGFSIIENGEIIKNLNSCISICEKAINEGAKILHNGI